MKMKPCNTYDRKPLACTVLPAGLCVLALLTFAAGCTTRPALVPGEPVAALAGAAAELPSLDEVVAGLPRFDVAGRVVDKEGNPVRRADVYLYYARGRDGVRDRLIGPTRTDRQGRYKFEQAVVWEPIPETKSAGRTAKYAVFARHDKHGIDFTVILEGDSTDDVVVRLHESVTHTTVAKDVDGNPMAGVPVRLCDSRHEDADDRNRRSVRLHSDIGLSSGITDRTGKVELMGPPEAAFVGEKDGYVSAWCPYEWTDAYLSPSAQVSGTATYDDGSPAAGAAVWFSYHGEGLVWSDAAVTDAKGNFFFSNVPGAAFFYSWTVPEGREREKTATGEADLLVEDLRPGSPYKSKKVTFTVKAGDRLTQDLVLNRGVVLAGKVVDLVTDEPVPNMNVDMYIPTGGRSLDSYQLVTDEHGEFRTAVPPGTEVQFRWRDSRTGDYIIDQDWLRQNNYQPYRGVIDQDTTDLVFKVKLWQVIELAGRVVDEDGNGVDRTSVYVHSRVPAVKTDESGAFTLKTAPKDRDFELFAITDDKTMAGLVSLSAGSTEATIPIEPTRDYLGQVVNTQGSPAGTLEFLFQPMLSSGSLFRIQETIEADEEGTFIAENLCPKATYYAFWSSDNESNRDYDFGNATIDLSKLEPGEPITIEATQFLDALIGRVVDESGDPIEGALIEMTSRNMVPQELRFGQKPITTDAAGEFVLERLAYGEVSLRISAKGYKSRSFTSPSDSVDFEAVLRIRSGEGSIYDVTIEDENGAPVADVPVTLAMTVYGKGGRETQTRTATTDESGKAQIVFKADEDVQGRGFIGCDVDDYDLAFSGVTLDEDAEVTFVLAKSGKYWTGTVADQNNQPVAAAEVKVTSCQRGEEKDFRNRASFGDESAFIYPTDDHGRFELTRFSANDNVWFKISAPGYANSDGYFFSTEDARNKEVFVLEPGAAVKGAMVVKSTGELLAVESITVGIMNEGSRRYWRCDLPGDGTFSCDGISPGQYTVNYYPTGAEARKYVAIEPCTFTVAAGETVEVVIEVEEGVPVKGKLIDTATGARPKGHAAVGAYNAEGQTVGPFAVVEDDGLWVLYMLEGTYELGYRLNGMSAPEKVESITVEKGTPIEGIVIEVDTSKIAGEGP